MARKNFLKQAQHSIVDSQTLIAEEPIQEDHIVESKRGQYEGTTRLKGARKIPLNKIKPDPNQPRTTFDEESLSELANSIKQHGVLEPITVEYIQTEGYFKIISGERRYRASQLSELTQMPC
ncbi:MAG: ParB/RepB/Spo0J family partition protein, partial [Caldithrix sp.]